MALLVALPFGLVSADDAPIPPPPVGRADPVVRCLLYDDLRGVECAAEAYTAPVVIHRGSDVSDMQSCAKLGLVKLNATVYDTAEGAWWLTGGNVGWQNSTINVGWDCTGGVMEWRYFWGESYCQEDLLSYDPWVLRGSEEIDEPARKGIACHYNDEWDFSSKLNITTYFDLQQQPTLENTFCHREIDGVWYGTRTRIRVDVECTYTPLEWVSP